MRILKYLSLIVFISVFLNNLFAQKIDFKGWGATGYTFTEKQINVEFNQEVYYEAKLQAEIDINKKIDAQIDLRGNSNDNNVRFREFSIKYKVSDHFKIKVGNLKRQFGYEYARTNREDLVTIDRSIATNQVSEIGYGGRSVSLMGYYNYSKKRPEFPYSYSFAIFKNNSQNFGVSGRFGYHFNSSALAANVLFQQQGGEVDFSAVGFGVDYSLKKNRWKSVIQFFYVQDPVEGIVRELQSVDNQVFAVGGTASISKKIKTDSETITAYEPLLLAGFFADDKSDLENHTIQGIIGVNVYLDKNFLLRFNGDLRLTKNSFSSEYVTKESRAIVEALVRF